MELEALGLKIQGVENVDRAASALDKLSVSASDAGSASNEMASSFKASTEVQAKMLAVLSSMDARLAQISGSSLDASKSINTLVENSGAAEKSMLTLAENSVKASSNLEETSKQAEQTSVSLMSAEDAAKILSKSFKESSSIQEKMLEALSGIEEKLGLVAGSSVDTSKSINTLVGRTDEANTSLSLLVKNSEKAEEVVKEVGDSAEKTSDSFSKFSGVVKLAAGAAAALGVGFSISTLKNYADAWSNMQSNVGSSIGDMSQAVDTMQRVVDIANASYSPLEQTVEVFSRNVATFKDLGRSAKEAADFTEAMNHAMVTTATRGQDAQVVINSLSRALATGGLNAMDFDTIVSRSPRVLQAMADKLGVTTSALRQLATDGKVTSDVIASGLVESLERLTEEAGQMPATVGDAFTRVETNFTALVGILDQTTGASSTASAAIISLADGIGEIAKNKEALETLVTVGETLAVVLGARLAAAGLSAGASFAMVQIQAMRAAGGITAMGVAARGAQGALALMGGPLGLAITAIGLGVMAWNRYGQSARDNAGEGVLGLVDAKGSVDDLVAGFEKLNALQQTNLVAIKNEQIAKATREASKAVFDLGNAFQPAMDKGTRAAAQYRADFTADMRAVTQDTSLSADEMANKLADVVRSYVDSGRASEQSKAKLLDMAQAAVSAASDVNRLTGELDALAGAQRAVAQEADPAAANMKRWEANLKKFMGEYATPDERLKNAVEEQKLLLGELYSPEVEARLRNRILPKNGGRGGNQDEGANYLKSIQERIALIGKETEYEQLLAKVRAGSIKFSTEGQKNAALAYAQTADLLREQAEFAQKASQGYQQNVDVIDNLHQSLALAALSGEALAVAQAKLSLNEYASQEQIDQVTRLSSELYKLQEQQRQREQFGTGKKADQFILGNVNPLSGGAFDDQVARYEAEAEAERVRYQEQLDRLMQARELQIETNRSYDELEEEAARQHAGRLDQIDQARRSVMLATYGGAFGAMAELLKNAHGEQSSAYQAMFAVSKAFAVANATMNAYNAISAAWASAPFPANLAAVAATAPQVLAVVGAIQGTQLAGMAHDGIDSIPKEGTWLLDKGERVMTSNTSAKLDGVLERIDARQRGGYSEGGAAVAEAPRVTVNLIGAPEGTRVEQRQDQDGEWVLDVMMNDLQRGGRYSRASAAVNGTTRRGT